MYNFNQNLLAATWSSSAKVALLGPLQQVSNLQNMAWNAAAVAAGVQGGASVLGTILSGRYSRKNIEATNAFNQEMWELDNAYNSPEQQMARLREAGLNPHLVYGNGTVANTSRGPVKGDFTSQKPYIDPGAAVGSALLTYQDVRMRQAQTDNIKAQTENINQKTQTEKFNTFLRDVTGKKTEFELSQGMRMADWDATVRKAEADRSGLITDKLWQDLVNANWDEQLKMLDTRYREKNIDHKQVQIERDIAEKLYAEMRNDWMKMGVTTSDNPLLRLVVRMMNEQGIKNWDDLVRTVKALFIP